MPKGGISNGIKTAFGSYERFIDEFMAIGTSQFGSG
jgi:superoxide dismutase